MDLADCVLGVQVQSQMLASRLIARMMMKTTVTLRMGITKVRAESAESPGWGGGRGRPELGKKKNGEKLRPFCETIRIFLYIL